MGGRPFRLVNDTKPWSPPAAQHRNKPRIPLPHCFLNGRCTGTITYKASPTEPQRNAKPTDAVELHKKGGCRTNGPMSQFASRWCGRAPRLSIYRGGGKCTMDGGSSCRGDGKIRQAAHAKRNRARPRENVCTHL